MSDAQACPASDLVLQLDPSWRCNTTPQATLKWSTPAMFWKHFSTYDSKLVSRCSTYFGTQRRAPISVPDIDRIVEIYMAHWEHSDAKE